MAPLRTLFQGLWNVVRFNWHYYLVALGVALVLAAAAAVAPVEVRGYVGLLAALVLVPVLVSLAVSAYVYDFAHLYRLGWLPAPESARPALLTVNAGFDEISAALAARHPLGTLLALDFYDPARHTEVSIRRARRAYPPYPGTRPVDARGTLPLPDQSIDLAVAFLAAHEIRDASERAAFFGEIRRVTRPGGRVVVVEHLRDPANFVAYTVGFLHFHSRSAWLATFGAAGLLVEREVPVTPFITAFILRPDGSAA